MQDKETIKNINNGIVDIMMPMYNELIELRSKLSSLSSGPEYRKVKAKFDDIKEQYSLFGKSNDMIVKFTSKEQVQRELQRIISERERLYKEFTTLKEEYALASKRGADVSELNQITNKARKISPIINCYDKLILIFNKSLGRSISSKITRVEKPIISSTPKPEVKKEEKRIEPKKKEVKSVKQVNEYLNDPDIKIIYDSSKKIQMLKGELFKHPQGSPKAKYLSNLEVLYKYSFNIRNLLFKPSANTRIYDRIRLSFNSNESYITDLNEVYEKLESMDRFFGFISFNKKQWTLILNDLMLLYPDKEFI